MPLVLATGLGIGSQSGVVEGFGLLAMASVCPIISVLTVGLVVTAKLKSEVGDKNPKLPHRKAPIVEDEPPPFTRSA